MRTPAWSDRARHQYRLPLLIALLAAAILSALQPSAAGAQGSGASADVATLRGQADEIAGEYFTALSRSRSLEGDIERNMIVVGELEAKAKRARLDARARALVAYKGSSSHLGALMGGRDALDTARRAHLISRANARDAAVYAKLRATTDDLRERRRELEAARREQAGVVDQLDEQARAMNAKLAEAEQRARAEVAEAAARAATEQAAQAATTTPSPSPSPSTVKPNATAPAPKPTAPSAPPNYVGTPGTHPRHDDPFLTCVRRRESGGNYGAVNPTGQYLGAYQFHQATWNGAANHAGRPELVGVPPNHATPYDQDDLAWSLYQWQGSGPWGGACE